MCVGTFCGASMTTGSMIQERRGEKVAVVALGFGIFGNWTTILREGAGRRRAGVGPCILLQGRWRPIDG